MENLNEDVLRVFKLAVPGTSTSYNLIGVVGGAHFNRVTGMCGDVSRGAAWSAVNRVRASILLKKDEIIRLPTEQVWHL